MSRASGGTAVTVAVPESNGNDQLCAGEHSGQVVAMQTDLRTQQPLDNELEGERESLYACLILKIRYLGVAVCVFNFKN